MTSQRGINDYIKPMLQRVVKRNKIKTELSRVCSCMLGKVKIMPRINIGQIS